MPQALKIITPLKLARLNSGLKANWIGRKIGKSSWWMSVAESGQFDVPERERLLLSEILGVPVETLFPDNDDDDEEAAE